MWKTSFSIPSCPNWFNLRSAINFWMIAFDGDLLLWLKSWQFLATQNHYKCYRAAEKFQFALVCLKRSRKFIIISCREISVCFSIVKSSGENSVLVSDLLPIIIILLHHLEALLLWGRQALRHEIALGQLLQKLHKSTILLLFVPTIPTQHSPVLLSSSSCNWQQPQN